MTKKDEDDLYALAPESPTKASPDRSKLMVMPPGRPRNNAVDARELDTEDVKNFYTPIWLLIGGVVVEFVWAMFISPHVLAGLIYIGAKIVGATAIMLAGVFIAASYRQIDLGKFRTAVLKLAAISIAPAAVFDLLMVPLQHIPFGVLLGAVAEFILYFALLGMFFDLDESDTWYCVWIIFLVHVGVYFALLSLHA